MSRSPTSSTTSCRPSSTPRTRERTPAIWRSSWAGAPAAAFIRSRRPGRISTATATGWPSWIGPDGRPTANGRPRYAAATVVRNSGGARVLRRTRSAPAAPAGLTGGRRTRPEGPPRTSRPGDHPRPHPGTPRRGRRTGSSDRGDRVSACCSTACGSPRFAERTSRICAASQAAVIRWSSAARAARRSRWPSTSAPSAPCYALFGARSQGPIFRRQDGRRAPSG